MKRMIIILMIVILVMIAGFKIYSIHLTNEFRKYCIEECEVNHVSKAELDNVKQTRSELATTNIIDYQDHITNTKQRLSRYDLSDEQSDKLESANVTTEYNTDLEYTTDELIELEADYKKVSDMVYEVDLEYSKSTYQEKIAGYLDDINQDKEKLNKASLSSSDKQQLDNLNKELSDLGYDESISYDLDQLNAYAKEYRELAKQYNYLATNN